MPLTETKYRPTLNFIEYADGSNTAK